MIVKSFLGQTLCFQTYSTDMETTKVKLGDIPKIIEIINGPNDKDVYSLIGAIDFEGRDIQTEHEIGHFIAFCYRGNTWIEFNDNKSKSTNQSENYLVKAKAIFYFKLPDQQAASTTDCSEYLFDENVDSYESISNDVEMPPISSFSVKSLEPLNENNAV